ncbi:hypothetical protein GCM10011490_03990 [Pseudoclavibacter endophyticus]|uniref:DUF4190 domain-containing protein n=1 Tax=Pseudoclavibacter endophyticus TaxID=1778590 RepID=UPI001664AA68|nr:DUF4190 domain-containing protein [Pseudoclavibacter endophyticus]GGA57435.1 hypothetical protein GCM10011490_03990 [Pseudoclavibacter endophyticus]
MSNNDPYGQPNQVQPGPPPPPAYGAPAPGGYPGASPAPAQSTNTMAIIALVSSFFISIAGIICGHIALNQIKKTGEQGRGLAMAGLIIGYVMLAITVIVVILYVVFFAWVFSYSTTYS